MKKSEIKEKSLRIAKRFAEIATRNIGLKLLAVLFAMILWSYIANSNTSFTRTKVISNVPVTVNGLSTMNTAGYAISSDLTELLGNVNVQVEAPIASISQITAGNITVSFDLSTVRKAGTRTVTLHGTSSTGKVVKIMPDKIDIDIEMMDTRTVPVNPVVVNGSEGYWYSVGRTNPGTVTVSGPTTLMQQVASAEIDADVADRTSSFSRAYIIKLMDEKGNEIKADNISRSTSSAAATVEVYPKKELPVAGDASNITVPDGYYVSEVVFEPKTVTVAGDSDLLASLTALPIEHIELTDDVGVTKTTAAVTGLSGFKYISSEQVYATITVRENETTRVMQHVPIDVRNIPEGCTAALSSDTTGVSVTGAKSLVVGLSESDLLASVDLKGLSEGTYQVDVVMDEAEGIAFDGLTQPAVTVTIEKAE